MKTDALVQRLVDSYGSWVTDDSAVRAGCAGMTQNLYPYTSMFSPIRINRMTVKNRLVMAPMGNIDMCEETGRPNDKMLQYFFARAKGGTGLLTTGLVPISHGIDHSITELGKLTYFPRIDRSRTVFAGWRDLAEGVHVYGAKIFVQLTAGLGRVGNPQCLINELKFPVSASFNPNFYMSQIPCMRLSGHKIKKIVKNTGQAAADAKAAGLDGVYLHGHEGYLMEQLTNPAFNHRKLGHFADWQAFGLDSVREIRKRVGDDYPIMYRIDLSLALNETYGDTMERNPLKKFKNGRTVEMTLDYMKHLVEAGVDIFDVDLGCYDNWWLPHPPAGMPAGCFLDVARTVKQYFSEHDIVSNAGVPVPVVAVGKLGYPDLAEQALRDEKCDMVMLGRPLLADPDWPRKAYSGHVEDITPCIGCQEGCINEFVDGGHPQCAVNARTSFEHLLPEVPPAPAKPKKIAVVGGGPAGILFATTAAGRGHQVTLFEKEDRLGGKLIPGSVPKIKFDLDNYRLYLERQAIKAASEGNLTLCLNTEASPEQLRQEQYDSIIFATGTKPSALLVPGIDAAPTVEASDLLCHPEKLGNARNILVVGGGVVGCETAYWLSYEHNCEVTVVEMTSYFMDGTCTANRGHLIHYMKQAGVTLFNCCKVVSFHGNEVTVEQNISKGVPDPYITWQPILPKNIENPLAPKLGTETTSKVLKADLIVLAAGGREDASLFLEAQRNHIAPELYQIGDSFAPGKVLEAVRAAYTLGSKI
ncbi:FAD-dependent oxidoreductase [Diplocloster agilis]|uniref:oxidoreductase n=1 Tax=Diplocloster agilis TaxID=2850323 RepID=UPI000820DC13|nr:FAD-dependent oxidoreductase [Suonthocola fibrivorans]MCU6735675.1 FAD-dependent oxidoreductase [Suonthocola fibrivorans]SCJ79371.1 NADH oxidase [uncultured Clostridium sp.]